MKKYLSLLIMVIFIAFTSGIASADGGQTQGNQQASTNNKCEKTGKITLSDAGAGPGIKDILLSPTCYAAYKGATGGGASMAAWTVSGKAQANTGLQFVIAATDGQENNVIYQKEITAVVSAVPGTFSTDYTTWATRGGNE